MPGPTLEIADAAAEIAVRKSIWKKLKLIADNKTILNNKIKSKIGIIQFGFRRFFSINLYIFSMGREKKLSTSPSIFLKIGLNFPLDLRTAS